MTDYYAILGVSRTATPTEIRDAYLKLARDTHPDRVKDPVERKKAEDVFKNVTAAYDTLSRDKSRRDYTSKLPTASETRTPPPRSAPPVVQGPPLAPKPGAAPPPAPASSPIASPAPQSADMLAQGIEAYKKQDYHTAVQLLNIVVNRDEKNAKAHAILALSMAKNPNWIRDALTHMETASRLEPKNVSYLVETALLLHSQGLRLRARRALDSAIALNPEHPDVARALKEIPPSAPEAETPARSTGETAKGLFDRFRKR